MLIVMRLAATADDVERVLHRLNGPGVVPRTLTREGRRVVVVDEGVAGPPPDRLRQDPAVEDVLRVTVPFELASRQVHPADTVVRLAGAVEIGAGRVVVLCERGIRTFEAATRYTLDIAAVPLLHELTHLPVIVDPSHATGRASLVAACARAAVAAGADGIMVEIHPRPSEALSDGRQALSPMEFATLVPTLGLVAEAVGRSLAPPVGLPAPSPVAGLASG